MGSGGADIVPLLEGNLVDRTSVSQRLQKAASATRHVTPIRTVGVTSDLQETKPSTRTVQQSRKNKKNAHAALPFVLVEKALDAAGK